MVEERQKLTDQKQFQWESKMENIAWEENIFQWTNQNKRGIAFGAAVHGQTARCDPTLCTCTERIDWCLCKRVNCEVKKKRLLLNFRHHFACDLCRFQTFFNDFRQISKKFDRDEKISNEDLTYEIKVWLGLTQRTAGFMLLRLVGVRQWQYNCHYTQNT